jgi:hypothetical protein
MVYPSPSKSFHTTLEYYSCAYFFQIFDCDVWSIEWRAQKCTDMPLAFLPLPLPLPLPLWH